MIQILIPIRILIRILDYIYIYIYLKNIFFYKKIMYHWNYNDDQN